MLEDWIATWRTHSDVHLALLSAIPEDDLGLALAPGGLTVAGHFAHVHDVRRNWLSAAGDLITEDALTQLVKFGQARWVGDESRPGREELLRALEGSTQAVEALLSACARTGRTVPEYPDSVTSFLAYLIAHESHHRGQVASVLAYAGRPLTREAAWAMWSGWWGREPA